MEQSEAPSRGRAWARALRPHQWTKNAFVLAPLVFAKELTDPDSVVRALSATILFCALSSSVYLINDSLDVEADRAHPVKRHRPIAAGWIEVGEARIAAFLMAALAGVLGWMLSPLLAAVGMTYWTLNLLYSKILKHVPLADVLMIANGFVLRALAGAVVLSVAFSLWLFAATFMLALTLGVGKRYHERLAMGEDIQQTRRGLAVLSPGLLLALLRGLSVVTTLVYLAYALDPTTLAMFGTPGLAFTTPFIAVGLWRFVALAGQARRPSSPTEAMLSDRVILGVVAFWGAINIGFIYVSGGGTT